MLQKLVLAILLVANLLADTNTTQSNVVQNRESSTIDLTSGTRVTDMPYGYYISEFAKSSIRAFENIDLTQYPDKKLLVGYGTYDIYEENCRYLDVPSNSNLPNDFENISTLGNATYAVSRQRMTFTQCKAQVAIYSGYVYTPSNIGAYDAVLDRINNTRNGGTARDLWVGYSRPDCSSVYLNDEGISQSFTNFRYPNEICNSNNIFTYSITGSKLWERTGPTDTHYCPIQINSPDYKRPIKFCAPWLRVEREWKLVDNEDLSRINGNDFNFKYMPYIMDYPKEVTICTETNSDVQSLSTQRYERTCNSYDDIKASAACMEQITLPQCHINECAGYIEDVCEKIDEFEPFKNYDIGYIMREGIETKVKVTDNKITSIYSCPPVNPPDSNCSVKETVSVLPVECPGSACADLALCLKTDTNSTECLANHPCEKSYGSAEAVAYNKDGITGTADDHIAYGLRGVCSDRHAVDENGTAIDLNVIALIEKKSSVEKRCLIYDTYEDTNSTMKSCVDEASSQEKVVSGSITQADIYKEDDRCIRINNIAEARPDISSIITYETKGFFKTSIQKAYIDGESTNTDLNSTNYLLYSSAIALEPYSSTYSMDTPTEDETMANFCQNTFSEQWSSDRLNSFSNAGVMGYVYNETGLSSRIITAKASNSQTSSISDDFGTVNSPSGWGVVVFDSNYKSSEFKDFSVSISNLQATEMATFLNDLPNGTVIAVVSHGNPKTNVYNNTDLKSALSAFGATTSFLNNLTTVSSYLLIGKKGTGSLKENVISSDGGVVVSQYTVSVSVPKVLEINEVSSCATNAGILNMSEFVPAAKDYIFSNAGISDAQVNSQTYCFLGGNVMQGDNGLLSISGDSTSAILKSSTTSTDLCQKYATCLSGTVSSQCSIEITESNEANYVETNATASTMPTTELMTQETGTFSANFNGYEDIFSIQEYTEGDFGYVSNYIFRLPKLNTVLFDGKEVSPIVQMTPIAYPEKYDFTVEEHTQTTKNQNPDHYNPNMNSLDRVSTWFGSNINNQRYSTYVDAAFYSSNIAIGLVMIFSPTNYWGWYDTEHEIYQELDFNSKYVANVYGYDPRDTTDPLRFTWDMSEIHTGTLERGPYKVLRQSIVDLKKQNFEDMGFTPSMISTNMTSWLEDNPKSWPTIQWYDPEGKKTRHGLDTGTGVDISKALNTIYMGATNSLSIVVPYIGDYEVIAYDKAGNMLASVIAQEQNFMRNVASSDGLVSHAFTKVQFATASNFNIANGQNTQYSNGSCLVSDFVEWGGGVSGAYYEEGVPDLGAGADNCLKSDDVYVKEHSATKITIRSLDSAAPFVIDLVKPMPFANKVYLVNLLQEETRKYECWDETSPCPVNTGENNASN